MSGTLQTHLKKVPCGSAADGAQSKQFSGNCFDGMPVIVVGEQVFRFREQAAFQSFRLTISGALNGKPPNVFQIASSACPGI